MAYDLEEQEKLDAVRQWWERYGTLIVTVLVVTAVSFAGWRGWQWYETNQARQAMGYFEALETAATAQPNDESLARVRAASETLREDFSKSGYASRGALVAARVLQDQEDYGGASEQLNWVIEKSGDAALVPLARLRLAGVLLEEKEYDAALNALDDSSEAFVGLYADRRGDIFAAQGKLDEARQSWQSAVETLGDDPMVQIIELKIDALGD